MNAPSLNIIILSLVMIIIMFWKPITQGLKKVFMKKFNKLNNIETKP